MHIRLKNHTGMVKDCKIGFSWTTFFFGCFVPLFRGEGKWFFIMILAGILTCKVSDFVFCFIYNKIYINSLLSQGYYPASETDRGILQSKGFLAYD